MLALDDYQGRIQALTAYLIPKASDLVEKGCTPQFAERLIIQALCHSRHSDLDPAIKSIQDDIARWASEEISAENRGLVLSDFLYQMLVPSTPVSHKLLDRRSHARLPSELVWLMVDLMGNNLQRTLCPYVYSIQLALACTAFSPEVVSIDDQELSVMQLLHEGIRNFTVGSRNSLRDIDRELESICGWFPIQKQSIQIPFKIAGESYTPDTAELADIYDIVRAMPQRSVLLVGRGLLSSTGLSESSLKSYILSHNILEAVIELPEGLIPGLRWKSALLVLDSKRAENDREEVKLLDASSYFHDFHSSIPRLPYLKDWHHVSSILKNGSHEQLIQVSTKDLELDLNPKRYLYRTYEVQAAGVNYKPLKDIADLYRGRTLGKAVDQSEENPSLDNDELCFEASIRDIGEDNILEKPGKAVRLERGATESRNNLVLRPLDILLSIKGVIGHVALVHDASEEKWVPSQAFQIIRVKDGYDPIVLFYQLLSDEMQRGLQSKVTGSSVRQIKAADIKSLPVPILSEEEQKTIRHYYFKVIKIKEEIREKEAEKQKQIQKIHSLLKWRPNEDFVWF